MKTIKLFYYYYTGLAQTPDGSAKVLLKISTKPPVSKDFTFQFTSVKNIQEREAIKAQIAELLARARGLSSASALSTPTPITPSSVAASPSPSTPQNVNNTASPVPLQQQATTNSSNQKQNIGSPSPGSPKSWRQEEFNDRRSLLTSSRELQTLHKELVVIGKSVDEEEFWSSPYVKRIRQVRYYFCCLHSRYRLLLFFLEIKKRCCIKRGKAKRKIISNG